MSEDKVKFERISGALEYAIRHFFSELPPGVLDEWERGEFDLTDEDEIRRRTEAFNVQALKENKKVLNENRKKKHADAAATKG